MTSAQTRLLDLPNEILCNIWQAILPNDIDNFANTCRHLRLLGEDVLEEHRWLKRIHGHFSLHEAFPSRVLNSFMRDRRLSHYPKKLTVFPVSNSWARDRDAPSRIQAVPDEDKTPPSFARIASFLKSTSAEELNGALTAVTAQYLPYLETIVYNEDLLRHQSPHDFADGLIKGMIALTTFTMESPVFPRLTHFTITRVQYVWNPPDLKPFLPVLTLPNLRSFEVSEYSCKDFDSLPFPPRTSMVETLDISPRRYSRKSMVTLLSAFKELKTFKLHVTQWGSEHIRGFFPAIYGALLKDFQSSLQHLEIHDGNRIRELLGSRSLKPFTALKSVIIQPDLLSAENIAIPRLIDNFPSSIAEIKFTRSLTKTQEEIFFAGYLGHREASTPLLPNLRLVVSCQFLSWRYKENPQPGGEYGFRYVKYHGDTVEIRYVDTNTPVVAADGPAAASQWKVIQLCVDDLYK